MTASCWATSVGARRPRVMMLLENDLYPYDVRVRYEAEALARAGYEVRVVAPRGADQLRRETVDGVAVERFRLPLEHRGRAVDLLAEYAVAHVQLYARGLRAIVRGADVLHVHNPPDTLFGPALVGRPLGCRFVFDQHDLFPELAKAKFGPGPVQSVARLAQRASVRLADLVIVTNESQREAAIGAGASPDSVVVVRNALRRSDLLAADPPRPGRLLDPRLVYVGALERQDGIERIPWLLQTLVARHGLRGTSLTVVGFGAEREPLERGLEELGLADRVTFTGRTEHARVLELIAEADICIDSAECSELNHRTTMVKVAEYVSLGKPTVAFALRETVHTAGNAAALARCGDWDEFAALVAELAGLEARRRELSGRTRARAEQLVWERSEEALLGAYERTLARAPARRSRPQRRSPIL